MPRNSDRSRNSSSRSGRRRKEKQRTRNKRIRRINNFFARFPHVITPKLIAEYAYKRFGSKDWVDSLLKWTRDNKEPSHDPLERAIFQTARKIGVLRESYQGNMDALAHMKDFRKRMTEAMGIPKEYLFGGEAARRAKVKERVIAPVLGAKGRDRRKSPPKPSRHKERSNATGAVRPRQQRAYNRKR